MLAFSFKYGKNFQKIIDAALESGDDIPENLKNVPVINPDYEFYWHCFNDLSSDRLVFQMGIGNITWQSIYNYCRAFNLDMDVIQDVFHIVRTVDNFYCDKLNEEANKKIKKTNGNTRL